MVLYLRTIYCLIYRKTVHFSLSFLIPPSAHQTSLFTSSLFVKTMHFPLSSVQAVLHDRNHLFHVSIRNEPLMKYSQAARRIVWMSRNSSSRYFLRKYLSNYSNSFSSRSIWIALAAFSFFSSITFAYICVVFTLVCPNILLTVYMSVPCANWSVA